jgi:hypothetical protein
MALLSIHSPHSVAQNLCSTPQQTPICQLSLSLNPHNPRNEIPLHSEQSLGPSHFLLLGSSALGWYRKSHSWGLQQFSIVPGVFTQPSQGSLGSFLRTHL